MKKVITGAAMLISGVIGFVGWFIACALTVQPGARSRVWGCLNGMEWIFFQKEYKNNTEKDSLRWRNTSFREMNGNVLKIVL